MTPLKWVAGRGAGGAIDSNVCLFFITEEMLENDGGKKKKSQPSRKFN